MVLAENPASADERELLFVTIIAVLAFWSNVIFRVELLAVYVKAELPANLPLPVVKGICPNVRPSSSVTFLRAVLLVIVKYKLSPVNSIDPDSGAVIREPDVNFNGAVEAAVEPDVM